ncbi:MAG: tetratricopeptide repeat protein [Flectobacillus sp.]|nr:tetratricopeptide repeat protein [Flectobacillus sp.]
MDSTIPSQKNIMYGSISAGGDVHIGDIIYQVSEDFSHSILFLRIEHLTDNNYTAQLTLKSRHLGKKGLNSTGLPLLIQPIQLNISPQLFQKITNFQSTRRLGNVHFRKTEKVSPEFLRFEEEQLITLLFDTFFRGDILTVCQNFVDLLEKRKIEELLLAISVDDTQIINLPFEMVIPRFFPEKLGQTRQSLAVNHFGLVRTFEKDLQPFDMQGKVASAAPLKMLFVTALPENMGEENKLLEIEEEQKRLIDAIGSFEATGGQPKIVIEFLDTASLKDISEALQKHQHDILHISGHGSYNPEVNQGVLHLEDEDGNHCPVLGQELGESLRQHQCVKLLILSACETAIAGNGVVEQLAAFGLPSIIAMRFSVTDVGAKVFTTALYEALSKAKTLTQAVAQAREQLWVCVEQARKHEPNQPHLAEWFTPVAYLNQYTEALVNLKENYVLPEDFYPRSEFMKSKNTRLIGSGFIGRKRYLNALRRSFAKGEHVCLHGLGGMGKTTLAEAFAHNYENHNHEVIIFRNGNQIAENFILDELFARLEADEKANKNIVRQIKQYLETDASPQDKLQMLIDNYLKKRKAILIFDNFEDVQKSETGEQQQAIGSASLAEFMTYLCQKTPPNCHLLFTTRYKIVDLAEGLTHLALDKMRYAEQYRLTNFSETLRKIPMSERQDIVKRLDGHPRAYEFLETLLKKDKALTWTKLSIQIGEVEADVWEDLLLEKIYQRLNPEEQQLLQVCAMFISRTPITALEYVIEKAELKTTNLELGGLLGLCLYDDENQTFEVHRLTCEWVLKNIIADENLKQWAFLAGEYFKEQPTWRDGELAKDYFEIADAWEDFAEMSFHLQDYYQLTGLYQKAFGLNQAVLVKHINTKTNADALNYIGTIGLSRGDYAAALDYLQQSLTIRQQIGDRKGEGTTLNNLAATAHARSHYDTALGYLQQSIIIQQQIGDRKGEGVTLNNFSQIYKVRGDYDTALGYLQQSLIIQQQIGDRLGEGATLNNLATTAYAKGDNDTALGYLQQSLIIRQQIGDRKGEGTTLNNLSQIYSAKGDYDTALDYLQQSLIIRQQIGDRKGEGTTLNNLATTAHAKGDYDTALGYLQQSLIINQQIGDRQGEGVALNNLSQIYNAKGDYDTALGYLQQSLIISQQIGDIAGLASTLNNMGAIYFKQKRDIENAILYFIQSYQINQKIGSPNSQYPANYLGTIIEQIGEQKFQEILQKQQ